MSDWAAVVDKASGRTYYYNKTTKATQWSKPEGFVEPGSSPAPVAAVAQQQPAAEVDPNLIGSLWAEVTDPSSGRNYYYNKVRNVK